MTLRERISRSLLAALSAWNGKPPDHTVTMHVDVDSGDAIAKLERIATEVDRCTVNVEMLLNALDEVSTHDCYEVEIDADLAASLRIDDDSGDHGLN